MNGQAGKGSRRRPMSVDPATWARNWDMAFGQQKPKTRPRAVRKGRFDVALCDDVPDGTAILVGANDTAVKITNIGGTKRNGP